jgi:microcin C transport system ATP-binding protein
MTSQNPLLCVENLQLAFGEKKILQGVSLSVATGETVAIVGESGSGKSVTALSFLQLLPNACITGRCLFGGDNLAEKTPKELQKIRGNEISFIFQEPLTALNPLHTVQKQLSEALVLHQPSLTKQAISIKLIEALKNVELLDTQRILNSYPHQLSGGQRQRVMIAMALLNNPKLLIADEPTTALDVTTQRHILALLQKLQRENGMALLLITHDLSLVRRIAQRAYIMKEGRVIEMGKLPELLENSTHPYTQSLLLDMPTRPAVTGDAATVYRAENVRVWYPRQKNFWGKPTSYTKAVDGISLSLQQGRTLGVVGESGSGKSTLGFALLKLIAAQGEFTYQGQSLNSLSANRLRLLRREMQIIFQDPFGSLSPRRTVGETIAEGLDIHLPCKTTAERNEKIAAALQEVGLDASMAHRYPHEFSGGQRQRIAVARALILHPKVLVLDEPTSALDIATQRQIVQLLQDLQARYGMAYIFISHDLKVIRALAHDILVMQHGVVVEQGSAEAVFQHPQQAYTKELLAAAFV